MIEEDSVAIWAQRLRRDDTMFMTIDGQLIDDPSLRAAVVAEASVISLTGRPSTVRGATAYAAGGRVASTIGARVDEEVLEIGILCAGNADVAWRLGGFAELLPARLKSDEISQVAEAVRLAMRPGCLGLLR